jgi:undecaprenyl-diphosphatase
MLGLDRELDRWVVQHRAEPFDTLFVWLSRAGSNGIVWILIAVAAALVWRRWALVPVTIATSLVADWTNYALKEAFDRERPSSRFAEPEPLLRPPDSPSFPSGHAATSFACATVIGASVPQLRLPLYVLAALVAWSRVYVGVHYPLDTVGGALYGVAVGLVMVRAVRALPRLAAALRRSRRERRPG